MSKVFALIPARYAASRFPGKLLKVLHGKTIIRRTCEAAVASGLFDEVIVVCDHELIRAEVESFGGKAIMSSKEHESGTDRIAEAAVNVDADIVVNIQGDEPFISKEALQKVVALFDNDQVMVGSLMLRITNPEQIADPNRVKVVVDKWNRALYFSRAAIPYYRNSETEQFAYQHIGVYAFRKKTLLNITGWPVSRLESIEKLENLRMLENGISIHLAEVSEIGISIDTEDDFIKAAKYLSDRA